MRAEKALGAELFFRLTRPGFSFNAAAYVNRFDDFIYQGATGEEEDELPVFRYLQGDATHRGFEVEASARLGEFRGVSVVVASNRSCRSISARRGFAARRAGTDGDQRRRVWII